jgi:hypothetical protein
MYQPVLPPCLPFIKGGFPAPVKRITGDIKKFHALGDFLCFLVGETPAQHHTSVFAFAIMKLF